MKTPPKKWVNFGGSKNQVLTPPDTDRGRNKLYIYGGSDECVI